MIKNKLEDLERIVGPVPANKFELIYLDGMPFNRFGNQKYFIVYNKKKEEDYIDPKGETLISTRRTLFSRYKKSKGSISREIYLKPYQITITKKMRERGETGRYFAKYIFDEDKTIFEIKKQDFNRETNFYEKTALSWKLKGNKEQVRFINEQILKQAEDRLTGMRYFLDPLQYYEEEFNREEQVTGYLARLKGRVESSISTDRESKKRRFRRKWEKTWKKKSTSTETPPGGLGGAY